LVYYIFGFCPQTLEGADILAYSRRENQYLVIVPDFLDNSPADPAWFATTATPSNQANIQAFFEDSAAIPKTLSRIPGIVQGINEST
jgi:hypothetical protein